MFKYIKLTKSLIELETKGGDLITFTRKNEKVEVAVSDSGGYDAAFIPIKRLSSAHKEALKSWKLLDEALRERDSD